MENENLDLTIIYLTYNEHPKKWTDFHFEKLMEAKGVYPLIAVTHEKLGLEREIYQTEYSHLNMYKKLLEASRMANTPYIAVAENDILYHPEHFTFYRPPMDTVAYDMSKWSLFVWNPIYNLRRRKSNATMIAPREYLIEALKERYEDNECPPDRIGEVGRHIHEKALGITLRNSVEVWCPNPSVILSNPNSIGYKQAHHPTRKKLGEMQAIDIPYWGKAEDIIKQYV